MKQPKPRKCFFCKEYNTDFNLIELKKVKVSGKIKEMCGDCWQGYLILKEKTKFPV